MRRKHTIEDMRNLATAKGGKCLSKVYMNNLTHLQWRCAQGHQFSLSPSHILRGQWCARCSRTPPKEVADMKALAASKGGKFISSRYINSRTEYVWECAEGHRWSSVPGSIQQGGWCPQCAGTLGERLVRLHLEQIFQDKFPSTKPRWLINSLRNRMQFDGYCARLKLAFEYHGQQHFQSVPYFQRNQHSLSRRQADDRQKRELCRAHGVRLIEISSKTTIEDMKDRIVQECRRFGVSIPVRTKDLTINVQDVFLRSRLQAVQDLARTKGGRCLSKVYRGSISKLAFECENHHSFRMSPTTVQQGHWCRVCAVARRVERQRKHTLEEMRKLAASRGGKCLSTKYTSTEEYLIWKCDKHNYTWRAPGMRILRGHWCKKCGAKRT